MGWSRASGVLHVYQKLWSQHLGPGFRVTGTVFKRYCKPTRAQINWSVDQEPNQVSFWGLPIKLAATCLAFATHLLRVFRVDCNSVAVWASWWSIVCLWVGKMNFTSYFLGQVFLLTVYLDLTNSFVAFTASSTHGVSSSRIYLAEKVLLSYCF